MIARPFPGLVPRQLLGPRREWPSPLPAGSILTHLARTALVQAYRALRIGPGDEVLFPALHCGVEVDAARFAGARIRFYPVTASLGIDAGAIASRMGKATRAVVVIHFFGFPQELTAVAGLCRERGAILIEDCAHVFIGAPRSPAAPGSSGWAAVYSLPKFLPVPDGGVLVLRDGWPPDVPAPSLGPPPRTPLARRTARLLLDHRDETRPAAALVGRVLGVPPRGMARGEDGPAAASATTRVKRAPRYDPGSSRFEPAVADAGPSAWTRRVLLRVDFEDIARIRCDNYEYLAGRIAGIGAVSALGPGLPTGAVPMVLPVRVARAAEIADRLFDLGVGTYRFGVHPAPELPAPEFPEAAELRETLLGLPVHQNLGTPQLDAVAAALERSTA